MRKIPIKAVSAVMACSLMIPFVACSKANESEVDMTEGTSGEVRSGNAISDSKPWFDCKQIKVAKHTDPNKEVVQCEQNIIGADERYLVAYTNGNCRDRNDTMSKNECESKKFARVDVFDSKSGEQLSSIDLLEGEGDNFGIQSVKFENGVITACCGDSNSNAVKYQERDYDPQTGARNAVREIQAADANMDSGTEFRVNNYKILAATDFKSVPSTISLNITANDGASKKIDLKDVELNLFFVSTLLQYNENTIIVPVITDGESAFYEVDLNAGTANRKDAKEFEWLDINRIGSSYVGNDGYTYCLDKTGVTRIDMVNQKKDIAFDYSNCGEDRYSLANKKIVYTSADRYILAGSEQTSMYADSNTDGGFTIDIFTKSDNNPNVGKTILELYYGSEYLDSTTSKAIKRFNETNSEYYIEVSDRYVKNAENADVQSEDDEESLILTKNADIGSKLAVDIINGEGPDILMNTANISQLNNSNYLVDLSQYVVNLAPEQYFTNVIESSKDGGKLYQLPITYTLEGIQTSDKYAGQSGVGFTFNEYKQFLNETLNGEDVISYGQTTYFTCLFSAMKDKFIVDGHVNLSVPEFEEIANYVKDYVPENGETWEETNNTHALGASLHKFDNNGPKVACFASCEGYFRYLVAVESNRGASRILGFPSSDGRGPMIGMQTSVAVSTQAESVDACGEFIKILMSDEIQEDYARDNMFVINRNVFSKVGKIAVESYLDVTSSDSNSPANNYVSEQSIVDLEKNINSCSCTNSVDSEIAIILKEEMAPYFIDQKQLPEVVAIAQDRVQKVLDERG